MGLGIKGLKRAGIRVNSRDLNDAWDQDLMRGIRINSVFHGIRDQAVLDYH